MLDLDFDVIASYSFAFYPIAIVRVLNTFEINIIIGRVRASDRIVNDPFPGET